MTTDKFRSAIVWTVGKTATGRAAASFRSVARSRIAFSIRRALDYVQKRCDVDRPLVDESFQTDGRFLFIHRLEQLINASKGGQLAMPDLLPQLDRIDRDPAGLPVRLYPFTRVVDASRPLPDPKLVVMNPLVSFGRPSVGGVPTYTIWSRFRAGDSPAHLADDYGIALEAIEEAIRCEAA